MNANAVVNQSPVFQGVLFRVIDTIPFNSLYVGILCFLFIQLFRNSIELFFGQPLSFTNPPDFSVPVFLAVIVFYLRGFNQDLKTLSSHSVPVRVNHPMYLTSIRSHLFIWILGTLMAYVIMRYSNTVLNPQFNFGDIARIHLDRLLFLYGPFLAVESWFRLLIHSIGGIIFIYLWVISFLITKVMNGYAKEIPINLFNSHQLTQFANPFLRSLLLLILIMAILPNNVFSPDATILSVKIGLPLVIGASLLNLVLLWPLLTLRTRIKALKERELACVEATIAGENEDALKNSLAYHHLKDASYVERLAYRQHVINVWDWPLHAHIQKIGVYLIIPPITWALSALVAKLIG